ncbi:hypothetical protein B0H67DRAFT_591825 [Lasiosphaeris hirsuta]|uniref:Uncharacterized protein n=1 Tax=Lasiosphaeris hirsuta TaxID=260670 RepID=A0AA40DKZ2_9PEZI|nr:hypothetical protein B0H67DRAFT_591825 [Lasiosphaeris hirsuta]
MGYAVELEVISAFISVATGIRALEMTNNHARAVTKAVLGQLDRSFYLSVIDLLVNIALFGKSFMAVLTGNLWIPLYGRHPRTFTQVVISIVLAVLVSVLNIMVYCMLHPLPEFYPRSIQAPFSVGESREAFVHFLSVSLLSVPLLTVPVWKAG